MKIILFLLFLIFSGRAFSDDLPVADVYKNPTCGCCAKWEAHLRKNGFKVVSHPTTDMPSVKAKYHIPKSAQSCHTAMIGKYLVEGHVPADAIIKLLHDHPNDVVGLAVPGMPIGSPGMEGDSPEHYDILSFDAKGDTKVFEYR